MRQQRRILFHLLALCLMLFVIINWSMTWTFPRRHLYRKLNWRIQSLLPRYHNMMIASHPQIPIGGNSSSSTNPGEEYVVHKEGNMTLIEEITLLKDKRSSFKPARIDHDDSKASRVEDLVTAIMKLARIRRESRIASSLRKALEHLPHVPHLPLHTAEDRILTTIVPPAARVSYDAFWKGLRLPVITCTPLGRLGNNMGEYATMYALRNLYNVSVVVHQNMKIRLKDFHHLSLPDFPGYYNSSKWIGLRNFGSLYNYAPIELAASGLFGPKRFVMREYAFEIQLFQNFKEELKREFAFPDDTNRKVRELFDDIRRRRSRSNSPSELVFVGFHIRRTDYLKHAHRNFGATLPGDAYFNRSLEYYRDKFPGGRVAFVAASDDYSFLNQALSIHPDVTILSGTSPTFDMAVLSSCNHSIVTLGSFGFWTGFLTGGEVVYPDVKLEREYRFSRAMYEKVGLRSFTPLPVD